MREPTLTAIITQELWAAYQEEVVPRLSQLDGPMGWGIKAMMGGIEDYIPGFFETLDRDPALQATIFARVRAVVARVELDLAGKTWDLERPADETPAADWTAEMDDGEDYYA